MEALSDHLIAASRNLTDTDVALWEKIRAVLDTKVGLEPDT